MIKEILRTFIFFIGSIIYQRNNSKIIYYHDIHKDDFPCYTSMSTPLSLFDKHINIIHKKKYKIVDRITNFQKEIVIAFDDGFKGIWDNRSYFINNHIHPTIFIANDLIGTKGYLTKEQILELQQNGFIFQSHTFSHRPLTSLNEAEIDFELKESKCKLEEILSENVSEICFPQGLYNNLIRNKCNEANYTKMYSSIPGDYYEKNADGVIFRYFAQSLSPTQFSLMLKGGMKILRNHYWRLHKREMV